MVGVSNEYMRMVQIHAAADGVAQRVGQSLGMNPEASARYGLGASAPSDASTNIYKRAARELVHPTRKGIVMRGVLGVLVLAGVGLKAEYDRIKTHSTGDPSTGPQTSPTNSVASSAEVTSA